MVTAEARFFFRVRNVTFPHPRLEGALREETRHVSCAVRLARRDDKLPADLQRAGAQPRVGVGDLLPLVTVAILRLGDAE